jgi:hypothetical protein
MSAHVRGRCDIELNGEHRDASIVNGRSAIAAVMTAATAEGFPVNDELLTVNLKTER